MSIKIEPHKSSLGMEANVAVVLMYVAMVVLGWIPYAGYIAWAIPLVVFFVEKKSKFVKFQAVQALVIGALWFVFTIVIAILTWIFIPRYNTMSDIWSWNANAGALMILSTIGIILSLALTVIIIYVVVCAGRYKQVELPLVSGLAKKAAAKLDNI